MTKTTTFSQKMQVSLRYYYTYMPDIKHISYAFSLPKFLSKSTLKDMTTNSIQLNTFKRVKKFLSL